MLQISQVEKWLQVALKEKYNLWYFFRKPLIYNYLHEINLFYAIVNGK